MKSNEIDALCFMNYVVGIVVVILSIGCFFLDIFFKELPWTVKYFNYHKGIGFLQTIVAIILLVIIFGGFKFIQKTWEYQQCYGE